MRFLKLFPSDFQALFIFIFLIGAYLSMTSAAQAEVNPRYRYSNTFVKSFNQDWSAFLYQEFDTDNHGHPDLNAIDQELGLVYSGAARWLDLGMAMGRYDGKSGANWDDINFPFQFITLKWAGCGVEVSDRNRVEEEYPEHGAYDTRYRNDLTLATAKKWTPFELQPFISDEIFYDFDARYLAEDQLIIGFNFKVTKNITAALSYMMDESHIRGANKDFWKDQPMAILTTTISF